MRKLFSSKSKKNKRNKKQKMQKKHILLGCVILVSALLIAGGAWWLLSDHFEDIAALDEYNELREIFMEPQVPQEAPDVLNTDEENTPDNDEEDSEDEAEEVKPLSMEELAKINQDFIGWISIKNHLEYPVVRGRDNVRYLNTTFTGQRNSAGALFMDYRNRDGFDESVAIIYGHRTRRGMLFSPLVNYLNNSFLRENPIITITTRDGTELEYRIFAAKQTDAWDSAYTIGLNDPSKAASSFPNAPANASHFLLLSTCTANNNQDERIIVFAAREE